MNSMLNLTPEVEQLANLCKDNSRINSQLYIEKHVKRGLRDIDGNGVVAGLTNISEIISKKIVNGKEVSCDGELYYRGYDIHDLVKGFISEDRKGFEETTFLLLFG